MTRRLASMTFLGLLALSCRKGEQGKHEHAAEHPEGHDHHAEGHGHGETPMERLTLWGARHELFVEHAPAVAGKPLKLLAHVTVLDGFKPLDTGELKLELEGPQPLSASASKPLKPGIYELELMPPAPGVYRGKLSVSGAAAGVVEGVEISVTAGADKPAGAEGEEHEHGAIEFLKEQQWGVPFATAFAEQGSVVASIEVAGTITTPPGGSAEVSAPIVGRLALPPQGLPRPGAAVKKGQLLATLAPAPASPEDSARVSLALAEAEARAAAASTGVERAERLFKDEAISQRELEEARREAELSAEAVRAAKRSRDLFAGASSGAGAGAWRLVSPIAGTAVDVRATPGAAVEPGDVLFRIVDTSELWIRARVPEQDASRIDTKEAAAYQPSGLEQWFPLVVTGDKPSAALVGVGQVVDPTSRTVDVTYSLKAPDPLLRVGGLVRVSLPLGQRFSGVVVPRGAVLEEEGRTVVYVQLDGEHFEERTVRAGPGSAGLIAIEQGLEAGLRIVTQGGNFIRLASRKGTGEAHGHIH